VALSVIVVSSNDDGLHCWKISEYFIVIPDCDVISDVSKLTVISFKYHLAVHRPTYISFFLKHIIVYITVQQMISCLKDVKHCASVKITA